MDPDTLREMGQALEDFRGDEGCWVGIVTGSGERAFCAGADIKKTLPFLKECRDKPQQMPPTLWRGFELWKPMIAAVNGMALGGGLELALACDLRLAAENASFGAPEVKLGLIPGWGGTQRLPRSIPVARAAELLFTGQAIDAQEAYRLGLVNRVVPLKELMVATREWADRLCEVGPLGLRAAKEAMLRGMSMPLEEGLRLELKLFEDLLFTEDVDEGIDAFMNKRKPDFKAR
jgi:enoyl-CoA hydratase